jgi:glycosyltransferase involved in cell wall biosynthesis
MSETGSVHIELLLGELKEVLRLEPNNIAALCRIGGRLAGAGRAREAGRCYRAAVEALRRHARAGDAHLALTCEQHLYVTFVSVVENEEHYRKCFADWKEDLEALGRRFHDAAALSTGGAGRVAFFLHNGAVLGHTEVLLKMLESRPRSGEHPVEPRVYVLGVYDPVLLARCHAMGIEVVSAGDAIGHDARIDARFIWLRQRFKEDRIGVCVWASSPNAAAFALSMRLAPVQIIWALRFHPLSGPYIDGYITWGARDESVRHYGGQDWQVVPLLLALDDSLPARADIEALRSRFPERVLFGTLAREEKINSAAFLRAVADILAAHPEAGFLWTGRSEHRGITEFFHAAGVADRCHFVGWVDTKLYAAALDVFLDTFPHGCGVTSYQAFAAGTPLLSYLGPYTIFGTHFWNLACASSGGEAAVAQPHLNSPDEHLILCARDAAEYVTLAGRLVSDGAWRAEIGARGRAFYQDELDNNKAYAERFFATVARIAAVKLGDGAVRAVAATGGDS